MNPVQIMTTTDNRELADRICRQLVSERLVACAQIEGPLTSVYRWQGEIETAEEWRCVLKTSQSLQAVVQTRIKELHSYDTPEILVVLISDGSAEYLHWLQDQLGDPS